LLDESIIGLISMLLNLFREVIGESWAQEVQDDDNPVVEYCRMLGKESINPSLGSTELFHDEQVMELIPSLSPMDSEPSDVILLSDGLQVVEARDIREVWNSCHSLQNVESGIWLVLVKGVNDIHKGIDELG